MSALPHTLRAFLPRLWPLVALIAIVVVIVTGASFAPVVLQRRTTQGLINLIAVVGLYVFVGNSGVLSFGNVAFMAIGAYVSALLTMTPAAKSVFLPDLPAAIAHAEWPSLFGALAGGGVAALCALAVGWPLMRLSGISASIATFAVLVVAYIVLGNWTAVTGGQNSLMGLPAYVDLWTALGWAVAVIVIAFAYQETRPALQLRASREDEAAAQAAGVDIVLHRLVAFVISAFLSGIAGVLLAHFLGIVRVENFYLDLTFLIVAMLIIGGRGSLTGAVAGTIVVAVITELLRQAEIGITIGKTTIGAPPGLGDVILALIMLLIILFRPNGLAGGRELTWPFGTTCVHSRESRNPEA